MVLFMEFTEMFSSFISFLQLLRLKILGLMAYLYINKLLKFYAIFAFEEEGTGMSDCELIFVKRT